MPTSTLTIPSSSQVSSVLNDIIDLTQGQTISATCTAQATNSWAGTSFVFTLVNCSVSPSSRTNGQTWTITPSTYGNPYSCQAVLSNGTSTKTFTIRGSSVSNNPPDRYGMQILDSSSNIILDTDYRVARFAGFLSGTVTYPTATTISVTGLTNDGTWGYNSGDADSWTIKTTLNSGSITITPLSSGTHTYKVHIFRD